MALINCPECKKEISDKSEKCIHCGFPLKNNNICIVNGTKYDLEFLLNDSTNKDKMDKMMSLTDCDSITAIKIIKEVDNTNKIPDVLNFETRTQFRERQKQQKLEASKIHCPKCNSTAITTGARGVNNFWGMLGASKTVNRCGNCGFTWKP